MRRHTALRLIAGFTIVAAVACARTPPNRDDAAAKTPVVTAVGPVPGPESQPLSLANPFSDDRTAMAEGRQLFIRFNCSGCHGGRAGGGMGPSLRDVDWLYGEHEAQLYSSIAEGRAHGMPSWQPRMTPDQIWKLVTYIKSLRTPNEPQRPSSE